MSVSQVQLTGDATWYSGEIQDSGTVALTASASGANQMQLSLTSKGQWTEFQSAIGPSMDCGWAGTDGIQHAGDFVNCQHPTIWFLPGISLQASTIPAAVKVSDLGIETGGPEAYRHLQNQLVLTGLPQDIQSRAASVNTADIDVDPQTFLPCTLAYQVFPDDGSNTLIPIEIVYSNYQQVDGIQIPFLIQRYVNGSLQLEIHVSSAQISKYAA
jgi:hypothetical protein